MFSLVRPGAQRFRDRADAGRALARILARYAPERPLVVGIANGGVPVAAEVAAALDAPLEVWACEKLRAPGSAHKWLGAIAEGNPHGAHGRQDLRDWALRVRGTTALPEVQGRPVVVVDDGVATGASLLAVLEAIRHRRPRLLVAAVPVGPISALAALRKVADRVHALEETRNLVAIGAWYEDFTQVPDQAVPAFLTPPFRGPAAPLTEALPPHTREIDLQVEGVTLTGTLALPDDARALVILADAAGTRRFSPHHRFLAAELRTHHLGTLVLDLMTQREELRALEAPDFHPDFEQLTQRLIGVTGWAARNAETGWMRIGYLEDALDGTTALEASARKPFMVQAVVSLAERLDRVRDKLGRVRGPTLVVGEPGAGEAVSADGLEVLTEADAPIESPRALPQLGALAGGWFERHLVHEGASRRLGILERQRASAPRHPLLFTLPRP